MVAIIPAILSTTEQDYKEKISQINNNGFFEGGWVQLDLMDNKFVPKLGVSLDIVKKYPNSFHKEAQLMVLDPGEWIDGLIELKVDRIVFPVEIDEDILSFINQIKNSSRIFPT